MLESPATSLEAILEHFGDRIVIGGVDTKILTFGDRPIIRKHVLDTAALTRDVRGFCLSSCGGLHGNIPLANLEAYFDARAEANFTPGNWRSRDRRP